MRVEFYDQGLIVRDGESWWSTLCTIDGKKFESLVSNFDIERADDGCAFRLKMLRKHLIDAGFDAEDVIEKIKLNIGGSLKKNSTI